MPTLRFARDRRGYESTYLLHAPNRRTGPDQPHLLYWFRSPPHVKIGRAAFDEDAIRALEEQHPDVEFDWDRILTTKPPAAPEARDPREARPARRPERRPGRDSRREVPRPASPAAAPPPSTGNRSEVEFESEPLVATPAEPEISVPPMPEPSAEATPEAPVEAEAQPLPTRRFVRVFDAPAEPLVADHHASELSAVERLLGAERLTVLRARHAEILARISARGGDPARLETLRLQASSVDPDGWVTEADVAAGLAAVDSTLLELHRIVGRRRRRRRRRRDGASGVAAGILAVTPVHERDVATEGADPPESEDEADGPEEE